MLRRFHQMIHEVTVRMKRPDRRIFKRTATFALVLARAFFQFEVIKGAIRLLIFWGPPALLILEGSNLLFVWDRFIGLLCSQKLQRVMWIVIDPSHLAAITATTYLGKKAIATTSKYLSRHVHMRCFILRGCISCSDDALFQ